MTETLWNWLMGLIEAFAGFGTWLTQPLPYINMVPLELFGVAGLTAVIAVLLVRLFVGG